MNFNAEMVVLSACNTGYGKLYTGEGAMSLAKAFAYAGCNSVVMSHWAAEDRSTSDIMQLFYKNLLNGDNKDVSLRKAKLAFLQTGDPKRLSPAYWNNFVVTGDVRPIPTTKFQWYWLLGGVLIFLAITGLLMRKRAHS